MPTDIEVTAQDETGQQIPMRRVPWDFDPEQEEIRAREKRKHELLRGWVWGLVLGLLAMLACLLVPSARADEPYLEVSALRIQSYTRNFPEVTKRLVEQRVLWGGEARGRVPFGKRLALIGRFYTEGAAGGHIFRDPGTWHRAVLEVAASCKVKDFSVGSGSYTLAVMAGAGASDDIERGRNFGHISDEANELDGPPPKYGAGVHLRDDTTNAWLNLRVEWDKAVGSGAHLAGSFHIPVFWKRVGLGVDATLGDYSKVMVMAKFKLWEWRSKKAEP